MYFAGGLRVKSYVLCLYCLYWVIMAQDDRDSYFRIEPRLIFSKVDMSYSRMHGMPPLHWPKSLIIVPLLTWDQFVVSRDSPEALCFWGQMLASGLNFNTYSFSVTSIFHPCQAIH